MAAMHYSRPTTLDDAVAQLQAPGALPMGGGTDLLPQLRESLVIPEVLVDLRRVATSSDITWHADGAVTIGASAPLARLACDAGLRDAFPCLAESCAAVGSAQIRTMGTLGGNLCQRPRCWYFRHGFSCHKNGGDSCRAEVGENHYHSILGGGPCFAVHPSDPAVALTALEATVHVAGATGARDLPIAELYTRAARPGASETELAAGEIVTGVTIPAASRGGRQRFDKVMQRGAFEFALVSVAAIKRTDGEVRLVLGGVAPRPWRVTDSIEEDVGSGGLSDDDIETLGVRALYDARPLAHNGYKVDVASAALSRAIAFLEGR